MSRKDWKTIADLREKLQESERNLHRCKRDLTRSKQLAIEAAKNARAEGHYTTRMLLANLLDAHADGSDVVAMIDNRLHKMLAVSQQQRESWGEQ